MFSPESFKAASFSPTSWKGSIVDQIFSSGGWGYWRLERQIAADVHEQRIKRQNETVLAFVMSAVTEECL